MNLNELMSDVALSTTYRLASMIGFDLLATELGSSGHAEAEIRETIGRLTARNDLALTEVQIRALGDLLGARIEQAADQRPEFAQIVDRADRIAQHAELHGVVGDMAALVRSVVLGIALLLLLAKLDGAYDIQTGQGHVEVSHGIPEGLLRIVDDIRDILVQSAGARPAPGAPPSTKHGAP